MSKNLYFDSKFYNSTDSKKQFSINVFENTSFIQDSRDWQVALVKAQLPLNSPIMVIKESDPIYFQVRDIFGSTVNSTSFSLSGSFYSPQEVLDKINEKIESELVNCPINGFYISSEGKLSFKTN
jgi:hypothetical protein